MRRIYDGVRRTGVWVGYYLGYPSKGVPDGTEWTGVVG